MNTQPANPDIPFERQMLHILRSYQRLQDEVLRLRAENSRLQTRCSILSNAIDRRAVSGQSGIPTSHYSPEHYLALLSDRDNRIRNLEAKLNGGQQRHIDQLNARIQNLLRKYRNAQSAYWSLRRKVRTIESIPDDLYATPDDLYALATPGTVPEEAANRPIAISIPDINLTLECPPPTFATPSAQ